MSKSVVQAIGAAYGLEDGEQVRVGPSLQLKMGLTDGERELIRSISPECWLVVRMDDFDMEVQLSFFVLCRPSSAAAAPLRMTKKTRGLRYMQEAEFRVSGGIPVAHCTVLLRKRRRNVFLSFLEKDRTRKTRGLNLGKFLMGVSLRALSPFCSQDAEMAVEAADAGSGRLVAFYKRLGLRVEGGVQEHAPTRMRGVLADVLSSCSPSEPSPLGYVEAGAHSASFGHVGVAWYADPAGQLGACCDPAAETASPITGEVCAICIDALGDSSPDSGSSGACEEARRCALACGHQFHTDCIRRWLATSRHRHCPLCKRAVVGAVPALAA